MRIRTANGVGFVRLVVALVIVLMVMSGSAAFGQQKQSSKVIQPSVEGSKKSDPVKQPIRQAPEMRTQEEVKVPDPPPPNDWWAGTFDPTRGGSGGGSGGIIPYLNPYPSGGGGNTESRILYKEQCPCQTEAVAATVSGTFGDWEAQKCDPTKGFESVTVRFFVGWRYLYLPSTPTAGQVCNQGKVCPNQPWVYSLYRYIRFVDCHQVMKNDDTFKGEHWDGNTPGWENVSIPCGSGFGNDSCP